MPELPEVETVCEGLRRNIRGRKIARVALRRVDLRAPFPENFAKNLAGKTIADIRRRAKYLLFDLGKTTLIAHLGMSGQFIFNDALPKKFGAHDHVVFEFEDGECLIYRDPRRFGVMDLCASNTLEAHKLLAHLGPEPLEKDFSAAYLKAALAKRKAPIKPTLMDQQLVVGVGNIYASEALFLSKIHPETPASDAAKHAATLVKNIRKVLHAAIKSGGSSLRDFVNINGETGYFQHAFNVYDRAGTPCPTCKSPIQQIKQAGRSTFFCAKCQKR